MIVAARALVDFGLVSTLDGEPIDRASPQFARYLATTLGKLETEVLLAVFLDAEGRYLADERVSQGDTHSVEATLRPLVARALELDARGIVLAHNHPSGDARASAVDRRTTRRIAEILAHLEISLLDHFVVAGTRVFSMGAETFLT